MAARDTPRLYRSVAREVARASISPRTQRNRDISANLRRLFERHGQSNEPEALRHDVENVVTFMRSQREYKVDDAVKLFGADRADLKMQTLLERYNPLVELTAEERIEATARRVGLNMPVGRDE